MKGASAVHPKEEKRMAAKEGKEYDIHADLVELRNWFDEHMELKPAGEPILTQYDPPLALPFGRRNEFQMQHL
jgi:hypothetical protein